jgi:ribosome-associated translation inhibitor RaiA
MTTARPSPEQSGQLVAKVAERDAGATGTIRPIDIEPITITRGDTMQIQINTDHNIEGHEALAAQVSNVVENALNRIRDHITRVEVHLSDEDSDKGGQNEKRCMMEARLEGRQPVAVTHQAETLKQAVDGAADKLARLIESTLDRLHDQASRRTAPQSLS